MLQFQSCQAELVEAGMIYLYKPPSTNAGTTKKPCFSTRFKIIILLSSIIVAPLPHFHPGTW